MGGENIVQSFSYGLKELELVNKAKDVAKRNNQSFSNLVIEALESFLDEEKKVEGPQIAIFRNLPHIKESVNNSRQLSILTFMPEHLEPLDDGEREKIRRHCVNLSVACVQLNRKSKGYKGRGSIWKTI